MSKLTGESKRSIFVLGRGLVAFALVGLGHFINHPEDLARRADAVMRAASDADPSSDSPFTHRSQGLIGDAVRAKARAAEPKALLEHVRTALEPAHKIDQSPRLQGPAGPLRDSTEGQVLPLKP